MCANHHVVVIEAAAGYGKSVLSAELVESWSLVSIDIQLEFGEVSARLLAARMRSAVLAAGYTEAAAAALDAGDDAVGAVDAMVARLGSESCVFVIDDVHHARADAAALIDRLASRIGGHQRMVILGRRLPKGAERLRRAEYFQLSSADLAMDEAETLDVCQSGFGLDIDREGARILSKATGGWTAATVLAAARLARTGEGVGSLIAAAAVSSHPAGAVAAVLDAAIVALGDGARPALAQIARLPLLDPEIVDAVTGIPRFFADAVTYGLPLTPSRGSWWEMPGPVRDHLADFGEADRDALMRAALIYRRRGETGEAVQLLLAAGEPAQAAAVLADTAPEVLEGMDVLEVQAIFDQLPEAVIESQPQILLSVARSLRVATRYDQMREVLDRARRAAHDTGNQTLARAVDAEYSNELVRQLNLPAAEETARATLAAADRSEELTRARAYQSLGMALCGRLDSTGRRDQQALDEAEACFDRATRIYRALGMRSLVSALAPYWAISIELGRGRVADAMRRLDEALSLVADRPRRWGYVMCFRTWVAAELGLDETCRACADELLRVAEQLDSDQFRAFEGWKLAILESYRGNRKATVDAVRRAELHRGTWWESASGDFMAEAADLLDRVEETQLAREYLSRVKAEPKDAGHLVLLAEAAIEARHGDPELAEGLLAAAGRARIDPREYWRITLLTGFAAYRQGDASRAGGLAATAFEEAARLGHPEVPLLRERAISEQLLGLAVETGRSAALALQAAVAPMTLSLLGRFELASAGRPIVLGPGQEAQLLKLVAINGGRMHAEQAIERIWPDVEVDVGRHRLRTVLNRLKAAAGPILARDGDFLQLDPAVEVDYFVLQSEARRLGALKASDPATAAAMAQGALVRYRGDLLPDDRYEDWTEGPRQHARALALDLLELCAQEASRRGDLDALRRMVERAIDLAPYNDSLYLTAATALVKQGRRGEALTVLVRARAALADIGIVPPRSLVELEESITGGAKAPSL